MVVHAKELKEAFVSGHDGTTALEIVAVTHVAIAGVVLRKAIAGARIGGSPGDAIRGFAMDVATIVAPCVISVTALADRAAELALALSLAAAVVAAFCRRSGDWVSPPADARSFVRDALGEYRAVLCLYTFVGILAVDFHAFPRRFAKAETYGIGLMDLGVGSFVVSDALFSGPTNGDGRDAGARRRRLARSDAASLRLVALGVLRPLAVKTLGYQEHVGEYGVHWNFFLSLAAVKAASARLLATRSVAGPLACAGLALLAAHQFLLTGSWWRLADVVCAEDPTGNGRGHWGLMAQNKEGIISLPGMIALHLLARAIAAWIGIAAARTAAPSPAAAIEGNGKESGKENGKRGGGVEADASHAGIAGRTAAAACVAWTCFACVDLWLERISRRAANASYVFWILASNLTWLASFMGGACLCCGPRDGPREAYAGRREEGDGSEAMTLGVCQGVGKSTPHAAHTRTRTRTHTRTRRHAGTHARVDMPAVCAAVNGCAFESFLAANVLTGAINGGLDTLRVGDGAAVCVVAAYATLLVAAASLRHGRKRRTFKQGRAGQG